MTIYVYVCRYIYIYFFFLKIPTVSKATLLLCPLTGLRVRLYRLLIHVQSMKLGGRRRLVLHETHPRLKRPIAPPPKLRWKPLESPAMPYKEDSNRNTTLFPLPF